MKQALIYVRVSTDEQAKEGQSIETQIKLCQRHADGNGITVVETYKDEGAKKAPLSRKQAALIKRKEKEKIQQDINALKDRINKRLAEDKEKAFHERIKKILN